MCSMCAACVPFLSRSHLRIPVSRSRARRGAATSPRPRARGTETLAPPIPLARRFVAPMIVAAPPAFRMARAVANWERLVRAVLRGDQLGGAYGLPVTGIAGNVPALLGRNAHIEEVLRAVDEIQYEDPDVARILCERAYGLTQKLDPNSEGRGVLQFKTGLLTIITQKLAKKVGDAIDRSQDIAKLQEFYKLYREKHKVDELCEDEMKLRESAMFSGNLGELERITLKLKKVIATLKVLWSAIEDVEMEISPEEAENLIYEFPMTSELIHILWDPDAEPKEFSLSLFEWITKGFLKERLIGSGAFGEVYWGELRDGSKVAVKKLKLWHGRYLDKQIENFEKEVSCLMKVRHKNVVRFLGYCAGARKLWMRHHGKMVEVDDEQRLLCFEYVPNGTLEKHIATDELQWQQRYEIIMGICAGMDHIHNEGHILHLDLKPENILLDNKLAPKIADFGLSWFFEDQSKHTVNTIKGSRGYMARECFNPGGKVSRKTDVYSLGAIILKLVTGSTEDPVVEDVLSRWTEILRNNQTGDSFDLACDQVKLCIEIALKCLNESPEDRPVLSDIIWSLDMLRPPTPQDSLSPMGKACSRMDLAAIHLILIAKGYRDDDGMPSEQSFQMWVEQMRKALNAKKRGDFAFRDKDFKGAMEYYTQFVDEVAVVSPTVYVRRSLCHLMCDPPDPDAALQDAITAQAIHPDCPTPSYMHAVALSKLNMRLVKEKLDVQSDLCDAMDMLNRASQLEERMQYNEGP